ncbi:hypothetical protein [Persephonella sp.]
MSFKKVKDILNRLTEEHVVFLKKVEKLEDQLKKNFSEKTLDELMDFIKKDVLEHARVEEEDLEKALEEAGITDFDTEALNFGHRTLDEIIQHLEYLIDLYKKGERKYMGRDLQSEIVKTAEEFFTTLRDHFTEEEDFFFPDILKYDIERFE